MAKKKQSKKGGSFSEVLGFKNILQNDILNALLGVAMLVLAIYLLVAFISYFSTGQADQSLVADLRSGEWCNTKQEFQNRCGSIGALLSHFFIARCFGLSALVIPVLLAVLGMRISRAYTNLNTLKWFLSLVIIMIWCSVASAKFMTPMAGGLFFNPGGNHGAYVSQWIENVVGTPGLIGLLALVALAFLTYISAETINVIRKVLNPIGMITNKVKFSINNIAGNTENTDVIETEPDPEVFDDPEAQVVEFPIDMPPSSKSPAITDENGKNTPTGTNNPEIIVNETGEEERAGGKTLAGNIEDLTPINPKEPWLQYKYPTLDLLKKYETDGKPYIDMKEQTANKNRIVEVLNNFGVQIRTITATVGPTITLYELTPAEGVRISKIRNLEDDIALSLSALGIRIIAPIPGKGTIGIEVPNAKQNIVSMESILNSKKFQETKMELPIALGKTITNEVFMADLAKIPHLLVAGATGQGKSVGLNAIITSLLYKKHPNELKLVLIDPKKVEFSIYSPIVKHFMAQVPDENGEEEAIITDVTKVIRTLNSLCKLMDHRYDMLKLAGARNIKEYNAKYVNRKLRLTDGHEFMPYIVVVIDEFGDLIMTAGKEIELPIARIAQLARAVGIHMVIATQRPTTRIITGNIKANFPGRVAFRVMARIDSQTILDQTGANQLIGKGDMLYSNGGEPTRVQCAFVDTPEVERINEYISAQPGPLYPLELPEPGGDDDGLDSSGSGVDLQSLDPCFDEAAHLIVLSQQGSTSMIQRHLKIGYNRAGRLMDQLEKVGIVGAVRGSKPREVLVSDINALETILSSLRKSN